MSKLIYNFGSKQGFFSEFNNLILVWIYCLHNNIKLELFEKNSVFSSQNSWSEFFEPYFPICNDSYHQFYNPRDYFGEVSWKSIARNFFKPRKAFFLFKHRRNASLYKKEYQFDFYTYELFAKSRDRKWENVIIEIPSLKFSGTLKDCFKFCVDKIYKFNKVTEVEIQNNINAINLPNEYIGVHIRQGDKETEANIFEVSDYLNKLKELSKCKNLFVLTDDYRAILELNKLEPSYTIYSFCQSHEQGYVHSDFVNMKNSNKRAAMLRLFASMEILKRGECFVGTYSSNPGMFLGALMDENKVHCLDFEEWRIW